MLEQGVDDFKIHALMAQGKLEVPDQRVLDGNAARKKDAVGRIHTPIDRTADLRPLHQRSDDQRESADEFCVANAGHRILEICLRNSKFTNGRWSFEQSIREFIVTADQSALPDR